MTPDEARTRHAQRVAKARADEAMCARDFLMWGDTRGIHAKFCIFGPDDPCSRTYNPGPLPADEAMYEGTGIGALFGLAGSERFVGDLAGWNLTTQDFTPTEGEDE